MNDHLSKAEIRKDAVQNAVEATASTVGQVATILTGAVKDVASAVGGLATEVFEIRDSARRAAGDHVPPTAPSDYPNDIAKSDIRDDAN